MKRLPDLPVTSHEEYCLRTATLFTAIRGRGRMRTRTDHTSLAEAERYASQFGDGRTMVYAVNDLGNSAHIGNF